MPDNKQPALKDEPDYKMYDRILPIFNKYMRKELEANFRKGDREGPNGWFAVKDKKFWLSELYYHVGKLQAAFMADDTERIKENCADIANQAMMVLDMRIDLLCDATRAPVSSSGEEEKFISLGWVRPEKYEMECKKVHDLQHELTRLRQPPAEGWINSDLKTLLNLYEKYIDFIGHVRWRGRILDQENVIKQNDQIHNDLVKAIAKVKSFAYKKHPGWVKAKDELPNDGEGVIWRKKNPALLPGEKDIYESGWCNYFTAADHKSYWIHQDIEWYREALASAPTTSPDDKNTSTNGK